MTTERVSPHPLRRTAAVLGAALLLTTAGLACGDDDDGGGGPSETTLVDDDRLREGDVAPGADGSQESGSGGDGVEDESGTEGGAPGTNPPASR